MADLYRAVPKTWGSPTMAAKCADEIKYEVVERVVALGTLPEIRARLSGPEAAGASLEELFIRITSAAPGPEREAP